jgi:hypothetical protein
MQSVAERQDPGTQVPPTQSMPAMQGAIAPQVLVGWQWPPPQ